MDRVCHHRAGGLNVVVALMISHAFGTQDEAMLSGTR